MKRDLRRLWLVVGSYEKYWLDEPHQPPPEGRPDWRCAKPRASVIILTPYYLSSIFAPCASQEGTEDAPANPPEAQLPPLHTQTVRTCLTTLFPGSKHWHVAATRTDTDTDTDTNADVDIDTVT